MSLADFKTEMSIVTELLLSHPVTCVSEYQRISIGILKTNHDTMCHMLSNRTDGIARLSLFIDTPWREILTHRVSG